MNEFYVGEQEVVKEFLFGLERNNIIEIGNEANALIKYVEVNDKLTYFVKQCGDGKSKGSLYNPWSLYGTVDEINKRNRVGEPLYVWRKVDKNIHDLYVKFLKTKNPSYLRNAEWALV